MANETNRLTDLNVAEVSLVGRPANKRSFLVFKSAEGGNKMPEINEQILEVLKAELPKEMEAELVKANLSEKAVDAVKGALKILSAYKSEMPADILGTLAKLAQMENPRHYDDDKKKAKTTKGLESYAPVKKADGSFDLSGVPEEQQAIVEALWKQAERSELLEKQLKEEQDQRLIKQFVEKAQSFVNLPIKAAEIGPVFKAIAEKSPKEFEQIDALLKAVDTALAESKIYKELGSNHQGASNAWDKVEQMAAQIVQKDENITKEQAITRVLEQNPNLYSEYLAEKR
jgi:hypothetical protein